MHCSSRFQSYVLANKLYRVHSKHMTMFMCYTKEAITPFINHKKALTVGKNM